MSNRCNKMAHDGQLWARLRQIVKVEEPVTFEQIRKFCPEVPVVYLVKMLDEITKAKAIACHREWIERAGQDARLRLTFTYDSNNGDQVMWQTQTQIQTVDWRAEDARHRRENGLIEAQEILEIALGDVIEDRSLDTYESIKAEDKLRGALAYIEDQIPPYLREDCEAV